MTMMTTTMMMMMKSKVYNCDKFPLQQVADDNKAICINFSDKFAAALRGSLQGGTWQGIDIRCSQQEEHRSLQGACAPFRPPSHLRLQQQARGEHSYESLARNLLS